MSVISRRLTSVVVSCWAAGAFVHISDTHQMLMKKFRVSLDVSEVIFAEAADEALAIFWDDFHMSQSDREQANVVEIKD